MNPTLNYAIGALLLPPTSLVLLALGGLLAARRLPRLGSIVAGLAVLALLVLSTPVVAVALARAVEPPPLADPRATRAQAIVVLGGGRALGAPEYGGETLNRETLQRVRYGAALARATGLPVLVSGGRPAGRGTHAEADLMREALEREFGVAVKWIENASNTTRDNARFSAPMLRAQGIDRILLVTHAVHMPRARAQFERQGLTVTPAPTGYLGREPFHAGHLVPGAEALRRSNAVLFERLALLRDRIFD